MQHLISLFPGTYFHQNINNLAGIYNNLGTAIHTWQQNSRLACPGGCGICCENFEPEVQGVEADYCSLFLLYRQPKLLNRIYNLSEARHCLFYDPHNPGHCAIYPARPLLCRLFAFAALTDKNNQPSFRLCLHIQPDLKQRLYTGEQLTTRFKTIPPLMQDYSMQVKNIDAGCQSPPRPLRQVIHQSLQKINLLDRLAQGTPVRQSRPH